MRAAVPLLRAAAPFNERLRRVVRGRAESLESLLRWCSTQRDLTRPLLWLHAPSVGEALMAQAILAAAREQQPAVQCVFTYFSPSAERIAPRVGADWTGYLPFDVASDVERALDATRPACVAFVRTEIWPVLVRDACRRGMPVVLVNAVLAAGSSRTSRAARLVLRPAYSRLDAVGTVSTDDIDRFSALGVARERVHITGDARFDQVAQRVQSIDRSRPLLQSLAAMRAPWLVAGSTWPADEQPLIDALAQLTRRGAAWRAIIAPHEPSRMHVRAIQQLLDTARISHALLPQMDEALQSDASVLIVDRVGVLADLYSVAAVAYVGGGFGDAGLHSIIEPAALGVPVMYGPRHGNAVEAARLATAGGGHVVNTIVELRDTLARWLGNADSRKRAGVAAAAFVQAHTGGAAANARLILQALATAAATAGREP